MRRWSWLGAILMILVWGAPLAAQQPPGPPGAQASPWGSPEPAAREAFKAVEAAEAARDLAALERATEALRAGYGANRDNHPLLVDALVRLGTMQVRRARSDDKARRIFKRALEVARKTGPPPGSPTASFAAAAHFNLLELDLKVWADGQIKGDTRAMIEVLKDNLNELKRLHGAYAEVFKYEDPTWTLAAGFRQGFLYQHLASRLRESPPPAALDPKALDVYRQAIEDHARELDTRAMEIYRAIVTRADEDGIRSTWIIQAREELKRLESLAPGPELPEADAPIRTF